MLTTIYTALVMLGIASTCVKGAIRLVRLVARIGGL